MARIVILGAGIGGMPMAYEMKALARPGDTITVGKKSQKLTLIHPLDHNYYEVCRTKLGWGSRLGGSD